MSYDPYANSLPAPSFEVNSSDFDNLGPLPASSWGSESGPGTSPALSWSHLPEGTKSVLVTVYDPDAPVPGGFWHWAAVIPTPHGSQTLHAGAGDPGGSSLPDGAVQLPNSFGVEGYVGANPPAGSGVHRYFIATTALNIEQLGLPSQTSIAMVHASIIPNTLGRAVLVATATASAT